MPDISKVKINDVVYNIKDEEIRKGLKYLLGDTTQESEEEKPEMEEK